MIFKLVVALLLTYVVSQDNSTTPETCGPYEMPYPCKPCPPSCNIFEPKPCTFDCIPGCDCLPGYIRNESTAECVPWFAYCM
ncbi:hypothetical protein QR680_006317 [Steinernema hermaphroditum]|uniref:TIL domain-containing protein n=1 Tax=Steinernema hermaphroditum TaxID=289476 RepID=A0AA39HXH4_9BILA|nr:hypothetical protein QR680_006317 [Steinernema hermaphroditum]